MVSLRTRAVNRGKSLFAFGFAAHAANLVASDASRVPVCAAALRGSQAITVFFTSATRAKALLRAVGAMLAGGHRGVGSPRSYSRIRWAGEGATIAAVGSNLPALRHTLRENEHAAAPIDIPDAVSVSIQSTTLGPALFRCWPFLCFLARLVTHLEAEAAPLASYAAIFACLRAALANNFTALTVSERQTLQGVLDRRFAAFADSMVVFDFFLAPFWGQVRARLSVVLWGSRSLKQMRGMAVACNCGSDTGARTALMEKLAAFTALEASHAVLPPNQNVHPTLWWRLRGATFRLLQPVAVRLLAMPP